MEHIILQGIEADELIKRIEQRLSLTLKLLASTQQEPQNSKTIYISRKETCVLLKISLPTLNFWTKKGLLTSYRIGTRILYKIDEVKIALTERKFTKFNGKDHHAS